MGVRVQPAHRAARHAPCKLRPACVKPAHPTDNRRVDFQPLLLNHLLQMKSVDILTFLSGSALPFSVRI